MAAAHPHPRVTPDAEDACCDSLLRKKRPEWSPASFRKRLPSQERTDENLILQRLVCIPKILKNRKARKPAAKAVGFRVVIAQGRGQATKRITIMPRQAMKTLLNMSSGQYFFGQLATPRRRPMYWIWGGHQNEGWRENRHVMGVELAGSGQAGGNADTGTAGEPRGEKHRDGLARKVEGAHHAAAGVAEELHDAEEIQHVREHEGHQHVRQQAVETDVETLCAGRR